VQPATKGQWDPKDGRFCSLGKGKRAKQVNGGDETRLAKEESQGQGAGRLFVAR